MGKRAILVSFSTPIFSATLRGNQHVSEKLGVTYRLETLDHDAINVDHSTYLSPSSQITNDYYVSEIV